MSIGVVGDLMIRSPGLVGRSEGEPGFAAMRQELRRSDTVVANLEVPLSCRGVAVPKISRILIRGNVTLRPALRRSFVSKVIPLTSSHHCSGSCFWL